MTITYFAVNGETLDVNHAGNTFLGKITLGLWDLVFNDSGGLLSEDEGMDRLVKHQER